LTGFLLDTNVVSETIKVRPDEAVLIWLARRDEQVFVPTIAIAEIKLGIEMLPAGRRRTSFEDWLSDLLANDFADRILPFDTAAAWAFGELVARARRSGHPTPVADAQIAAVATVHGLTVATRDIADFAGFGVPLVNPFEGA